MAIIRPFKALRPTKEKAQLVASVPYDVVNRDEAKHFAEGNPLSYLHITRSEIDLPEVKDVYSKEVYFKAKENLQRILKEAPLNLDEKPSFYLYRLIMDGRSQTGICATFSVDDYDNDVILKHEKTRKVKEDDRTNHIVTTEAQTGIVFLTYRGVKNVNDVVEKTMNEIKPEYDFTAPMEYNTRSGLFLKVIIKQLLMSLRRLINFTLLMVIIVQRAQAVQEKKKESKSKAQR